MEESSATVRPLGEDDLPAALDLVYAEWAKIPRFCQEQMIRRDPWRHRQRSFGAFVDGRLVAQARFHYRPTHIGRVTLHMIGVCEVVTHRDYRRRGLGHSVLKAALEWMRTSGIHLSMLYTGVDRFYAGLGWGILAEDLCYVPAAAVPQLGEGRYRITHLPIKETPPSFAEIYGQSCGRHPISLLRTAEYWRSWPLWAEGNLWFGLLDDLWSAAWKEDEIVAYGSIQRSIKREGPIGIVEACAFPDHQEALFDIHDDLIQRCRQADACEVELNLPADHPLAARLASIGQLTTSKNAMIRIVNLCRLLEDLRPELESRSTRLSRSVRVRLESGLGSATLSAAPSAVSVEGGSADALRAEFSPAGLGSLLLGFQSAHNLAKAGEINAGAATLEVLDILFPCLHSHYWQIDHF